MTDVPQADAGRIRVGNAERDAAINRVSTAHSLGQLTVDEFDERVRAATDARTTADLAVLTADLPPTEQPHAGWRLGASTDIYRLLATARRGTAAAWSRSVVRIAVAIVAVNVLVWAVLSIVLGGGGGDEHGDNEEGLYFWPIWVAIAVGVPFVIEAVQRRKRA